MIIINLNILRLREKRESLSRSVTTSLDLDFCDCESTMERSTSAESLTDLLENVVGTNEVRRTSRDLCRRRSSSCTPHERLSVYYYYFIIVITIIIIILLILKKLNNPSNHDWDLTTQRISLRTVTVTTNHNGSF